MLTNFGPVKDSGSRREFDTGARRDLAEGKGRFDLIPYQAELEWAIQLEQGAKKYGDRNWEKGMPLSVFLSSAKRHLSKLGAGHVDENHAAAVLFNVGAIIHIRKLVADGVLPKELDDLPRPEVSHG